MHALALVVCLLLSSSTETTPPPTGSHSASSFNDLQGAVFTSASVIILDGKQVELKDLPAECDFVSITTQTVTVNGQPQRQVVRLEVKSR